MYFNISDASSMKLSDELAMSKFKGSNTDFVETGLSEGEVRQSLLDRFREDVLNISDKVNAGIVADNFPVFTDANKESAINNFDNAVYELENEQLLGLWPFVISPVIVSEDVT